MLNIDIDIHNPEALPHVQAALTEHGLKFDTLAKTHIKAPATAAQTEAIIEELKGVGGIQIQTVDVPEPKTASADTASNRPGNRRR